MATTAEELIKRHRFTVKENRHMGEIRNSHDEGRGVLIELVGRF